MSAVSEQELAAKAVGPRVTPAAIEAAIVSENYFTAGEAAASLGQPSMEALAILSICVLVLDNGFTILGKSAPADPANFDAEIGRRFAREDAVKQIWPLMGFELKARLKREKDLLASKAFESDAPTYIGTKVVHAWFVTRRNYNLLRGWDLPADENGDDEGYLVEYTDRAENPPHMVGWRGYISWSPREVFERSYRLARVSAKEAGGVSDV